MNINEQMIYIVDDLINKYGPHCKVSRKELYELLETHFGTKKSSIMPSDYCYDRTNKGIKFLKQPRLFSFLGDGMYECLGENYVFNGPVYTREKGITEDIEVGFWENGIFYENENWKLYGLK